VRALASLEVDNVDVHVGDGWAGLPGLAPFDRIVITAAPDCFPAALAEQLAEGEASFYPWALNRRTSAQSGTASRTGSWSAKTWVRFASCRWCTARSADGTK
jgi:protein-L-isoaspartate O-methyltransferase